MPRILINYSLSDSVRIVGVSRDRSKEDLLKRVNDKKWTSVKHFFIGTEPHPGMAIYGVQGIPHVVLVDKEGKIVFAGHPMDCKLEKEIENLLADKPFEGEKEKQENENVEIPAEAGKKFSKAISGQFQKEVKKFLVDLKYCPVFRGNASKKKTFSTKTQSVSGISSTKPSLSIEVRETELPELEKITGSLVQEVGAENIQLNLKGHKILDLDFGTVCNSCQAALTPELPQFYCNSCKIYFCDTCADKLDDTKAGNAKLIHPHNLVYISVKNGEGLKGIEEFRFGKNIQHETNIQEFGGCSCDICGESPSGGPIFICLNCKPGPALNGGWVDICYRCMNNWRTKPRDSEDNAPFVNTLKKRHNHDSDSHVYLRIYFGTGSNYRNF